MIAMVACVSAWCQPTDVVVEVGLGTYYSEGVMRQVAENRELAHLSLVGYVALNRAGDIGREVWIQHRGAVWGPFVVVDCAQERHFEERLRSRYIVEVPYWLAEVWGMVGVGPLPMAVWYDPPPIRPQ